MKAETIYKLACAVLLEKTGVDPDFQAFFPSLASLLLQEALPYENARRAALGQPALERAPVVAGMEDDVPCCDAICRLALPYGVAAYYFQDEMDDYRAQDFRGRYILALREAALCSGESVEDCYGREAACRG